MKRYNKKRLGIFLAAVMAATTLFPMHGTAAAGNTAVMEQALPSENEIPDSTVPTESIPSNEPDKTENTIPDETIQLPEADTVVPGGQVSEEGTATEDKELPGTNETNENPQIPENNPADEQIPEENEPEEDQPLQEDTPSSEETVPAGDNETNENLLETENSEEDPLQHLQNTSNNIMPAADNFDITPPVIEGLTFAENGQTLTPNDTLHFTVSAYDADSEITSISISILSSDPDGNGTDVSCTKDGNGNLYSGTASCKYLRGSSFYVASVRATDSVQNYSYLKVMDDNQEPLYQFKMETEEIIDPPISISNLQMQLNDANGDGKLSVGDSVTYTADVICDSGVISSISMLITCQVPERNHHIPIDYDDDTKKITGTYTIRKETYPAAWEVNYINILTTSGKNHYFDPDQMSPTTKLDFVVEQEDYDMEKPVIQSIVIDKNGQYVSAGDVITIKVKASDENLSDHGMAHFAHTLSNVSSTAMADLILDRNTNEYTGTIVITDNTYPCEWFLTALDIHDETGNYANLNAYQENWLFTRPWYYRVKSGNTYVENLKDVTLNFYGLSKRQYVNMYSKSLLSSETIKNAGNRMSLKELGVTLPKPEPIEGVSVIGWEYNGMLIDENTPLLFDIYPNMVHNLTARYDKGCANVSLRYIDQNGYPSSAYIAMFVDKETTYNDILNMLKLPPDADTGNFTGFELQDSNGDETTGDIAHISVKAKYSSYQIQGKATYIDKNGSAAIISLDKSYPTGTKIKDILSDLGTPPEFNGTEFEKWFWQFSTLLNEEEELSVSTLNFIRNFNVTAIYKGKTTVKATYTYTDQNGAPARDSKIILIDGKNLSEAAIKASAGQTAHSLKHFDGLKLSEWTVTFHENEDQYKNVSFTAQYSNCIITLYYPDGTQEQIILDKGASFTLPVEKGNYKDISWEGYDKGETITVSEDMYFYATDSEYSDNTDQPNDMETSGNENGNTGAVNQGTSENGGSSSQPTSTHTGGIQIPEQKIAEITAEIANASAGATVTVDMKDATVIPKQVLESIRGKSMNIVLRMNGYSWVINGMDVAATDLKDINLEVTLDTNTIPGSLIQSIAGDQPARQLSLTHNGDFGFRARLVLNLGSEHSGETGNLYYHDSTGKLVFIDAGKIDKDGMVSLTFSHASDYVIIIDSKALAKSAEPVDNAQKRKSPKTGE